MRKRTREQHYRRKQLALMREAEARDQVEATLSPVALWLTHYLNQPVEDRYVKFLTLSLDDRRRVLSMDNELRDLVLALYRRFDPAGFNEEIRSVFTKNDYSRNHLSLFLRRIDRVDLLPHIEDRIKAGQLAQVVAEIIAARS